MNNFNTKDLSQFEKKGIAVEEVILQIDNFKKGFPFLYLSKPATKANGIINLHEKMLEYMSIYEAWEGSRLKFVPASGAASRMFKTLYEALDSLETGAGLDEKTQKQIDTFFERIKDFAFYEELSKHLNNDFTDRAKVLKTLLLPQGMNYGNNPKGLLLFHKYKDAVRTAFEEHLVEGALYGKDQDNNVHLHFTVSNEHRKQFEALLSDVKGLYEKKYEVKYLVSFSEQKPATDTIAVDAHNNPFRDSSGEILFRPGGHGALLENLNDCDTTIAFIKNIDNVVAESHAQSTVNMKKALAGFLIELTSNIFNAINNLDKAKKREDLKETENLITDTLKIQLAPNTRHCEQGEAISFEEYKQELFNILNRPVRVCGMVKNEGEPGGGPFIAHDSEKRLSLQVVESSQIDMNDAEQKEIFKASEYFNPVDLVCYLKDYKGNKFNLLNFRDPSTGFISEKTKDGKVLKAQELPGLWNGAMSNWNTVFVEVPLSTFNPVKTVFDLLKKAHFE